MRNMKKVTSVLCAVAILIGIMVTAPTALAAENQQWVEKAPMGIKKYNLTSEVVNGKIYAIGGRYSDGLTNIDIYNPVTDTWTTGAPMMNARFAHVSAVVDGKIYVIGGHHTTNVLDSVEIYDPATDTWTTGASIPETREAAASAVVDGKIYVMGGYSSNTSATNRDVKIYDPTSNTWTTGTSMPTGRRDHVSAVIDHKIYAIGGRNEYGYLASVEIYDPTTDTWTTGASMPQEKGMAASVVIGEKIYVINGYNETATISNSVYIYDSVSNSWSVEAPTTNARYDLSAAFVNNTIYAFGGYNAQNVTVNLVEALDLSPVEHKLAVLLNVGENLQLSVSNDLADNASMTWSSSDQNVATVDANGKVTAVGVGTCDISAQNADGSWKESIPVRVFPGIADLNRLAVHLKPAQNAKLYLTENPLDTTWISLDTSVATVDANGKITAVAQGLAILEATVNGETHQIYVRVKV